MCRSACTHPFISPTSSRQYNSDSAMPSITDKTKSRDITALGVRKRTHKIAHVFGPRRTLKSISPEPRVNSNPKLLARLEIGLNLSKQRPEGVSNRNFPHALRSNIHHFRASLRLRPVRVLAQDCHQIVMRCGKIGDYGWNVAAFCASNGKHLDRLLSEIRPVVKDS